MIDEPRSVVEENIEDVEPYFALGALFRSRGEHERAIRVHQALALRARRAQGPASHPLSRLAIAEPHREPRAWKVCRAYPGDFRCLLPR